MPIYLDHNATTPVKPEVIQAMTELWHVPHNASSVHSFGREAKKYLEKAREQVAASVNATGHQVIFTSSGTEANNLALHAIPEATSLIVSEIEHPSVLTLAQKKNASFIPVDEHGVVRIDALEELLQAHEGKALVSVMLANNETGVIQPIHKIAECVYKHGGYLHCDAVQGLGKIPVDIGTLNVDMMTLSSHKIGGPQGAAALIIKKGIKLETMLHGGGQELGFRAGTETIPAIVGFGKAASMVSRSHPQWRDQMEAAILSYAPDAYIIGREAERLPNTSCIIMPGMSGETQVIACDLAGIAVSSGAACSSGKVEQSHVLRAMGVEDQLASQAIRVSLGDTTTLPEIERFVNVWKELYDRAKQKHAS